MPLTGARPDWLQRAEEAALLEPGRGAWYSEAQILEYVDSRVREGIDQLRVGISPMQHLIIATVISHAMLYPESPGISVYAIRKRVLPPELSDRRETYPRNNHLQRDVRSLAKIGWVEVVQEPGRHLVRPSPQLLRLVKTGPLIQSSIDKRLTTDRGIVLKQDPAVPKEQRPAALVKLVEACCRLAEQWRNTDAREGGKSGAPNLWRSPAA